MNKTLKLAVAAALLAGASSANAGISIPAGDWTLDIGGIVNAYYTSTTFSGDNGTATGAYGALFTAADALNVGTIGADADATQNNITTGLLPNYLVVSGKTRQNDLDVAFTISINPGASTKNGGIQGPNQENRQAFLTFGDASWGSIKLGKDLGIYASDAILNDMTLLGVGSGAGGLAGNTTTTGRIGTGFMYADWKAQIAYTSPNFNGLSFTAGVTQAFNATAANSGVGGSNRGGSQSAYEAKASYAWTGDIPGKVWASAIHQNMEFANLSSADVDAWDIGTTINVAGFGLTGYYGSGEGIGQTIQMHGGFDVAGKARDSDQWYAQGTYTLASGTKLGASYGMSTLEGNSSEVATLDELEDSMWTIGAYHPITKHLNLVAEYSVVTSELETTAAKVKAKAKTIALGAIMFF
jgi:predicted porin